MGNAPIGRSPPDGKGLVERVYESVREAIVSGTYPPASRLLATTIAEDNGVSSIPVREALRRLETERLIVVELNRGATVAPLSVEDMLDIYETRIVLEGHALRLAHPRLGPAELERAERDLTRMIGAQREPRSRQAYEHHRRFHFGLYEPCGSPWTMHVVGQLWVGAERYLRLSAGMRDTPAEFAAEHQAVLAAIRESEVDAAVRRLEQHLRRTATLLERAFRGAAAPTLTSAAGVA